MLTPKSKCSSCLRIPKLISELNLLKLKNSILMKSEKHSNNEIDKLKEEKELPKLISEINKLKKLNSILIKSLRESNDEINQLKQEKKVFNKENEKNTQSHEKNISKSSENSDKNSSSISENLIVAEKIKVEEQDDLNFDLPPQNYHKCDSCGNSFSDELDLKIHKSLHKSNHKCDICGNMFSDSRDLEIHKKSFHFENVSKDTTTGDAPEIIKNSKNMAINEEINKNSNDKITDEENMLLGTHLMAEKPIQDENNIIRKNHKKTNKLEQIKLSGKNKCHICERDFPQMVQLKGHKLIHERMKFIYHCEKCQKQFPRKDKLKSHLRIYHSAVKNFYCRNRILKNHTAGYMNIFSYADTKSKPPKTAYEILNR